MARDNSVITLVPKENDRLRVKLDALALDIADSLMGHEHPITERISGLKALTAYWQTDRKNSGATAQPTENAFERYRREQEE